MMAALRRLLRVSPRPITHTMVQPQKQHPTKEAEIRDAQASLVKDVMRAERRSWEIRQELAGNVLSIVSGDSR